MVLSTEPAPSASFTRTTASYINILLTRTVNCLLTKQKSYWQQTQCGCGRGCVRDLVYERKRDCVCLCVGLKETERGKETQPLMYSCFWFRHLQVSLQGPICRMHLMLTPTFDSTVCLSTTKRRAKGDKEGSTAFPLTCLLFVLYIFLPCSLWWLFDVGGI